MKEILFWRDCRIIRIHLTVTAELHVVACFGTTWCSSFRVTSSSSSSIGQLLVEVRWKNTSQSSVEFYCSVEIEEKSQFLFTIWANLEHSARAAQSDFAVWWVWGCKKIHFSAFFCRKYRVLYKKKKHCKGKRRRPSWEKEGRGKERLARSRSYPGFSIGILLSVKVILPVNSVFIPLLNEIHRSMEREQGREWERERERDMTKKWESSSPLPRTLPLLFSPLFVPSSDIQWRMKIQRGINHFYRTGANEIDYLIQFLIPQASTSLSTQQHLTPAAAGKKREEGALCKWNAFFPD